MKKALKYYLKPITAVHPDWQYDLSSLSYWRVISPRKGLSMTINWFNVVISNPRIKSEPSIERWLGTVVSGRRSTEQVTKL